MYPSDYGYSVLSNDCARTTNLGTYSNTCAGKSWLYGKGNEWTLSFYSSRNGNVFFVNERGCLNYDLASYGYAVRPVLYLDAMVYKVDGDGNQGSPYIIGM